jgi:hypothetical protein
MKEKMKGKIVKMKERKKGRGRKKRKQGEMEVRNQKRQNGRKADIYDDFHKYSVLSKIRWKIRTTYI